MSCEFREEYISRNERKVEAAQRIQGNTVGHR